MSISQAARAYLERPSIDPPTYPAVEDFAAWMAMIEQRDGSIAKRFTDDGLAVTTERQEVAGVDTYVLRAEGVSDSDTTPIYLDLHGGGLIFGAGDLTRVWGSMTASRHRMLVWCPDYRMPPRHPYPAAVDDSLAVYRALLKVRDPAHVVVGGASAGGNLAAALLLRARDEGLPMPAALVLPTPMVDLTESGDTFHTLEGVHDLRGQMPVNLLYANGHDLTEPYLSPVFADLSDFPPTFLSSGTRDLLLSNTVRMHRKLLAAGVETELHVFEAMPHGGFSGSTPEDAELDAAMNTFLAKHLRQIHPAPVGAIDANKSIAYRYFDRRWNHRDSGIIDELLGEGMDIAMEKAHFDATHAAFGDLHVTVDDLIAENDQVVVRWTVAARFRSEAMGPRPSQAPITFRGLARLRIIDGRIVAFEGFSDLAELGGS
ncbi:hypothetical protein GCM10022236_34440 [Microlunatus ginsengisoli]|uniref:Alpha/beta hydrolase fold-3 domain-containing protein n=2 Tax=Microlunatus ginsengisoli TaxID=363863 RepID=A0ABP7ACG9_9ACTN